MEGPIPHLQTLRLPDLLAAIIDIDHRRNTKRESGKDLVQDLEIEGTTPAMRGIGPAIRNGKARKRSTGIESVIMIGSAGGGAARGSIELTARKSTHI